MEKFIDNLLTIKKEFAGYTTEEKLLFITSVCMFLPFFLVGIPLIVTVIYCLVKKDTRKEVFSVTHAASFLTFGFVGFFAAIFNKNLWGFLGGIFILILIVFNSFYILHVLSS